MDENNLGTVLRDLRKSKNKKQLIVCNDVCSRTHLSKIENNLSIPNIYIMGKLLDNLDVSFDEFFFRIKSNEVGHLNKNDILNKYFGLRDNLEDLSDIISLCETFLSNHTSELIEDIMNACQTLIVLKNSEQLIKNDSRILKIWDRLNKMDAFTIYELKLLNSILFHFETETAIHISKRLLRELNNYVGYIQLDVLKISILMNISTLHFYNKNFIESKKYAESVIDSAKKNYRYDLLHYTLCRLSIINQEKSEQSRHQAILDSLGLEQFIYELNNEDAFFKENNI